jgi:hypothetical protein
MKSKKHGKYRGVKLTKFQKEEAEKLAFEALIKEIKKNIGTGYEK